MIDVSTQPPSPQASYLGDGCYVRFDGWQLELMANSHISPTDTVYLEPGVFHALVRFAQQFPNFKVTP